MASTPDILRASCACGSCAVETAAIPKARIVCHCTICQAFTGKAFSDVVILPGWRGWVIGMEWLKFRAYKRFRLPPPNLDRGRCSQCDTPVVETVGVGPARILFVPAANFDREDLLPVPSVHVFCEHARQPIDGVIDQRRGYLSSQQAIFSAVFKSM